MIIDTRSTAIEVGPVRKVAWAGRILVVFGIGHLAGSLALTSRDHAHRWFSAQLWRPEEGILDMSPAMAAFWLTTGSLGAPLIVLGVLVLWLGRRGMTPPPSVAWMLVAWSLVAAVILEPAPWLFITLAGGLLLAAARPSPRQAVRTPPSKV